MASRSRWGRWERFGAASSFRGSTPAERSRRMKFGFALDFASPVRTLDQQLDRYMELIRLGERYGFDSVTAGEGYGTRPDWGHVSSPLLVLAALAPRTSMRLGT